MPPTLAAVQLPPDSIGYKLLKAAGWTPGAGLGTQEQGIAAPLQVRARQRWWKWGGVTMGLGVRSWNGAGCGGASLPLLAVGNVGCG